MGLEHNKDSAGIAWDDMVVVGRVARAHGNRGEVIINAETDFPDIRFRAGSELRLRRGDAIDTLRVGTVRHHQGRPVVAFEGVGSMDAAEALAGAELRIRPEDLLPLSAGGFYRHELVGCRVETTDGRELGDVQRVEEGPGMDRLIVAGRQGEILVPLAADICVGIDPTARRIVIRPPDGLIELNE